MVLSGRDRWERQSYRRRRRCESRALCTSVFLSACSACALPALGSPRTGLARRLPDSHEVRLQLREREAVPLLQRLGDYLERERQLVLPRSPIGEAFTYLHNQWSALVSCL
jgi:hypothetical protein